MNRKKSLQELTLKDNFMFGAVMLDPENCKETLERCLGIEIERVEVDREKSIVYNPEFKGVRLDIYAKDEKNTHYNVEMQVLQKPAIEKRARYYHGQIDMELLLSGMSYKELPDAYVIFICDFDPYGYGKYRYTRKSICEEVQELSMEDGARTIFLSTKGTNKDEVPAELVRFLDFVGAPLQDSHKDFKDDFIRKLQNSVNEVKVSREMGARYMTFEELLKDEREEGRIEGRIEGEQNKLISLVKKKVARGQSLEQIADALEESVDVIKEIVEGVEFKNLLYEKENKKRKG